MTRTAEYTLPAVMRCLNVNCANYTVEYLAWREDSQDCPSCKVLGCWVRTMTDGKARKNVCGVCLRVLWLSMDEWPVGHYGWGFLQLNNRSLFTFICTVCQTAITEKFPNLKVQIPETEVPEILPKIIQPSKLLIPAQDG